VVPPRVAEYKSRQNKYYTKKNFLRSINFSLLSQTDGNSISTCDFAKFIFSVRDTHCDYSRGASKNVLAAIHNFIIYSKRYASSRRTLLVLRYAKAGPAYLFLHFTQIQCGDRGSTVVKVLCYNSEGRWFDSRWCQWNFSLT